MIKYKFLLASPLWLLAAMGDVIAAEQTMASSRGTYQGYLLDSGDRIQLKVYDLKPGSIDAHEWTPLNGEFTIGPDGTLSLPLIGEMDARGKATTSLSKEIAEALKSRVGLVQLPSASLQIVKYRPFYILGDVENPGEYDFRPGLSVTQAVSIAGGVQKANAESIASAVKELTTRQSELKTLRAEQVTFEAKRERLRAEIAGDDAIKTDSVQLKGVEQLELASALKDEMALFNARQNLQKGQVTTVEQGIVKFNQEFNALKDKEAILTKQTDLANKELNQVRELLSKGLSISARELAAEQAVTSYQNSLLDTQIAKLRAQQEITKLSRDLVELKNKRKNDALNDIADVDLRLKTLSEKVASLEAILEQIKNSGLAIDADNKDREVIIYSIQRKSVSGTETLVGDANTSLKPADVLQIKVIVRAKRIDRSSDEQSEDDRGYPVPAKKS